MYLDSQIYELIQYYRTIYLQISNFMIKMKKSSALFITALSLCSLISCNKLSAGLEAPYVAHEGEIYFGSIGLAVSTKAVTETTASSLQTDGFNTAVCIDNDDNDVMFNEMVTYDSGIWKVSGKTFYYPAANTISAYAVYPTDREITVESGVATVAYAQNATEDLVVAQALNIPKQANAIELSFRHVLSQVKVRCKGLDTNADYVLKTIEFTVPASGTYQFADGQWADLGDATAYTYYNNEGADVSTSAMQAFGESMTFVPSQVTIRAVWDCKNKVDHTVVGTYDQSVTANLTAGNCSTFNLSLPNADAAEIAFTVSVENWDSEEQNITMEEVVGLDMKAMALPYDYVLTDPYGNVSSYRFCRGNVFAEGEQYGVESAQYEVAGDNSAHKGLFTITECREIAEQVHPADFFSIVRERIAGNDIGSDEYGDFEVVYYLEESMLIAEVEGVKGLLFAAHGDLPSVGSTFTGSQFKALEDEYKVFFLPQGWYYSEEDTAECVLHLDLDDTGYGPCLKKYMQHSAGVKYMFRPADYQYRANPVMSFNISGYYYCQSMWSYYMNGMWEGPEPLCPKSFQDCKFTFDRTNEAPSWRNLSTVENIADGKSYEVLADGDDAYIMLPMLSVDGQPRDEYMKIVLGKLDQAIPVKTTIENALYYMHSPDKNGYWTTEYVGEWDCSDPHEYPGVI